MPCSIYHQRSITKSWLILYFDWQCPHKTVIWFIFIADYRLHKSLKCSNKSHVSICFNLCFFLLYMDKIRLLLGFKSTLEGRIYYLYTYGIQLLIYCSLIAKIYIKISTMKSFKLLILNQLHKMIQLLFNLISFYYIINLTRIR